MRERICVWADELLREREKRNTSVFLFFCENQGFGLFNVFDFI